MPSISIVAVAAVVVSAALAVAAAHRGDQRRYRLFKPLTTTLVIAAVLWAFPAADETYQAWILAGLLLSLLGDVLLMLGEARFLFGLASFLAAQLFYARAFTLDAELQAAQLPWLAPFAFFALVVVIALWKGLPDATMRGAVIVYAVAIALMAWRAVARLLAPGVPPASGACALAGACLFLASDATLALHKFRWPFRAGQAVIDATYWAAQLLIALSVLA